MVIVAVHARDHNLEANFEKEKKQTKAALYGVWGDFESLFIIRVLDSVLHFGDQVFRNTLYWLVNGFTRGLKINMVLGGLEPA